VKTKVSPTLVGLFVLGALGLGVVALLMFGGVSFFSKPQRFVVYFDESIHGLDLGSPVKLSGVRVGRVVDLNVRFDESKKTNKSQVAVTCELSKNMMTDGQGVPIDVSSRAELQGLVDKGLRAQLDILGLATGLLFVQLDFKDPKEYPAEPRPSGEKYVTIPYLRSAIAEFQTNLTDILNDVKKADFAGIGLELRQLLATARIQVDGLDLKGVADQWKKTGQSVQTLTESAEIKQTFVNLNGAITDLRATLAKLDSDFLPAGKELTETLAHARVALDSIDGTAVAARQFFTTNTGVGEEIAGTLEQLSEAADAVKRLADFIERNPNALLTGKKRPP
jgi:paraquat-inducible protein B